MMYLYTDPNAKLSNNMASAGSALDGGDDTSPAMQAYAQADQSQQPPPAPVAKKAPPPPAPAPQQAPPQPQGSLMDKWSEFMDHPEHRAGMMQFAVNMLSGRGFGESLGAAAEATGRNVTQQQTQEQAEEELALKERGVAAKEKEAGAYAAAQAKGDPVERQMRMALFRDEIAAKKAAFHDFNSWLLHPTDLLSDTSMDYIKSRYPSVQNKSQLVRPRTAEEKAARQDIESLFNRTGSEPPPQVGGGGGGKPTADSLQAKYPGAKIKYDPNTGAAIAYDPKTKQPYPGQI